MWPPPPERRSSRSAALAGVALAVLGALTGLFGVVVTIMWPLLGGLAERPGSTIIALAQIGLLIILAGVVELGVGAAILAHAPWARPLGAVLAVANVVAMGVSAVRTWTGTLDSIGLWMVGAVLALAVLAGLLKPGDHFGRP